MQAVIPHRPMAAISKSPGSRKYIDKIRECVLGCETVPPRIPSFVKITFCFQTFDKDLLDCECTHGPSVRVLAGPIMHALSIHDRSVPSMILSKVWSDKDEIILEWSRSEADQFAPEKPKEPKAKTRAQSSPSNKWDKLIDDNKEPKAEAPLRWASEEEYMAAVKEMDRQHSKGQASRGNLGIDLSEASINTNTNTDHDVDW